jgi:hypothetical protein
MRELATLMAFSVVTLVSGTALADGEKAKPSDAGPSAAVLVGYAVPLFSSVSCADTKCNPYGVGVGGRVGYTFDSVPFYVGGTFVYHFGYAKDSKQVTSGQNKGYTFYPGIEGGYSLRFGAATLRPFVGAGVLFDASKTPTPATAGTPASIVEANDQKIAIWPGLTALFHAGWLFVGVDARYVFTNKSTAPIGVFATFGANFFESAKR